MSLHSGDRHHISLGIAYSLATSVVASSAAAVVKWLASDLSAWQIVWIQYGICSALMLPWLSRHGVRGLRSTRYRAHLIRAAGGWLGFTTYYVAIARIPLVDASLLRAAAPLWVPLVVWAGLRERVPAVRWLALVTGFAGICLVLQPQGGSLSNGHLIGLGAGISLAVSMAYTRALSSSEPAGRVLFYYFFFSFIASTPMALVHWSPVPATAWPALLFVGGSIYLTMVFYNRAYSYAPTSLVAPLGYIAVPLAALIDWLVWGHLPGTLVLAGSLLVVGSGVLAVTLGSRHRSEH